LPMPKKYVKQNQKENQVNEEVLDFNKPSFTFIPKGNHRWRQQGPYLVCKSCELQHAVFIGMNKVMTGINKEGGPILKNRKSVQEF